jgi:hypothetical protein
VIKILIAHKNAIPRPALEIFSINPPGISMKPAPGRIFPIRERVLLFIGKGAVMVGVKASFIDKICPFAAAGPFLGV